MAMSRQEREGTKLSEAIKLASRRHMPRWPSPGPFTEDVANPGLERLNEMENGARRHGGESEGVTNVPSINARTPWFVLGRPCDDVSRQREKSRR